MDDVLLKAGSPNYGIGEELIRLFLPQCYFIWKDLLHAWYIYIGVVSGVIAYKLQLLPSIHGMTGRYIYIYCVRIQDTNEQSLKHVGEPCTTGHFRPKPHFAKACARAFHGSGALAVKSRGSAAYGHYEHHEEPSLHVTFYEEEENDPIQGEPILCGNLDPRASATCRPSWRSRDIDCTGSSILPS